MPDLTDQLRALLPLAERATAAPWTTDGGSIVETDWDGVRERPVSFSEEYDPDVCEVLNSEGDANFIAAARNFLTPETIRELIRVLESRGDA